RVPVPGNHDRSRGREPGLDLDVRLAGVQVLVDVPLFHLDRPFTYRVPESLQDQVHLGSRVKVPFGGRRRVDGWVGGRVLALPPDARDVLRVVSPIPSFGPVELDLFRWVADRYAAAVTDTLRLAIPPRVAAVEASVEAAGDGAARVLGG